MIYSGDLHPGDIVELGSAKVTDAEVIEFASRYDPQSFHLDDELGRQTGLGGLVASGWHTAAIFQRLLVDGLLADAAVEGSPGLERLHWPVPVRPGDVLTGRLTVERIGPSLSRRDCKLLCLRCELVNSVEEPVLQMTLDVLFRDRAAAGGGA